VGPLTPKPLFNFYILPCLSYLCSGEHGDFKYDTQVDGSTSQPTNSKPSLTGAWLRHVTHFNFWGHIHTSGMAKATVVKFYVIIGYVKSCQRDVKLLPKGRGCGHTIHFNFNFPYNIYGIAKSGDFKFCTLVGHVIRCISIGMTICPSSWRGHRMVT